MEVVLNDLQKTKGMIGARSVLTRPSSRIAVFDEDDDIFYIVQTDINNNKNVTRYRFVEEPEPKPEDIFASKDEINELKGEIGDVKQSIQELVAAITAKSIDPQSGSNSNSQKFVPDAKGKSKSNGYSQNTNGTNAGSEGNN